MDHDEPSPSAPAAGEHGEEADPVPAVDLIEDDPSGARRGPLGWARRHQRVLQGGVAMLVVVGAVAASAGMRPPERDDTVETAEVEDRRESGRFVDREDRRAGESTDDGDLAEEGDGRPGRGGSEGRGGRRGRGSGREDSDRDWEGRGSRNNRPPANGGTAPPSTTPPAPAPLVLAVSPGDLPPFGLVTVAPNRPCPSGTSLVRLTVTARGGSLDGRVVKSVDVPVKADGSWSVAPFTVAAIGGVDDVDWAATADRIEVSASCGALPGVGYAPGTVRLGGVGTAPTLAATLVDGTVEAELDGCPGVALLHLVVGPAAPPPGEAFEPTDTVDMVRDGATARWTVTTGAPSFDPSSEGLWVSAECLDAASEVPVWRYRSVALAAP